MRAGRLEEEYTSLSGEDEEILFFLLLMRRRRRCLQVTCTSADMDKAVDFTEANTRGVCKPHS